MRCCHSFKHLLFNKIATRIIALHLSRFICFHPHANIQCNMFVQLCLCLLVFLNEPPHLTEWSSFTTSNAFAEFCASKTSLSTFQQSRGSSKCRTGMFRSSFCRSAPHHWVPGCLERSMQRTSSLGREVWVVFLLCFKISVLCWSFGLCFSYFRVLSSLCCLSCVEFEVLVHMLYDNLLESSGYLWRLVPETRDVELCQNRGLSTHATHKNCLSLLVTSGNQEQKLRDKEMCGSWDLNAHAMQKFAQVFSLHLEISSRNSR